jgi:HlyD family secretion protein
MRGNLVKLALTLLVIMAVASGISCSIAKTTATPATASPTSEAPRRPAASPPASPRTIETPVLTSNQGKTVRGDGNISVSTDANLYFGSAGQIKKIYVKEGDRVTKGQELAKLDTINLEVNINQNRVALDQAKLAQTQAQSALASAQLTFEKTQSVVNIKDQIINAEWRVKIANMNMEQALSLNDEGGAGYWRVIAGYGQKDVTTLKKTLSDFLTQPQYVGTVSYDIAGMKYDSVTVQDMRVKQLAIDIAQQTLDKSQDTINQAQRNLDLAQQQLTHATITAPFDGIIATLNVKEGDIIPAPAQMQRPPIYLVDLTAMQIKVGINELDIPRVKQGQKATVKVDALPALKLDGKVTEISTLPSVQGGVVDYNVTVSFTVPAGTEIKVGMAGTGEITLG